MGPTVVRPVSGSSASPHLTGAPVDSSNDETVTRPDGVLIPDVAAEAVPFLGRTGRVPLLTRHAERPGRLPGIRVVERAVPQPASPDSGFGRRITHRDRRGQPVVRRNGDGA